MVVRPLFQRYQKFLLAFANTRFGRDYLLVGKHPEGLPIVKLFPDGLTYQAEPRLFVSVFFPRSPYLGKFRLALESLAILEEAGIKLKDFLAKPEWVIPHFQDLSFSTWLPLLARTTSTFNPDADTETNTVDGYAARGGVDEIFATIRSGAGTAAVDDSAVTDFGLVWSSTTSSQYQQIRRYFCLFNTASIPDTDDISSAKITLYVTAKSDSLGGAGAIVVVTTTPASNTAVVAGDYANTGTTAQGTAVNISAITTSANNDWTLNATGIASISKTGITKFGTKLESDRSGTAPTWSSNVWDSITGNHAESASNKPTLTVEHAPPTGGNVMIFGGGAAFA